MPRQIYKCPSHGEFEVNITIKDTVPSALRQCPVEVKLKGVGIVWCHELSPWIPSVPNFIGGPTTGAKKE